MVSEYEHVWHTESIRYGRYTRLNKERYQEMEHRQVCKNCSKEQRLSDRYYGKDKRPGYVVEFDSEGRQLW
jgi:hypothetical protein